MGDPLANGHEGFGHCVSCHRLVFVPVLLVSESTDKRAAAARFVVAQALSEGSEHALFAAELNRTPKCGWLDGSVFGWEVLAWLVSWRADLRPAWWLVQTTVRPIVARLRWSLLLVSL